jgi:pimeloyl-ACP methyl ester carboxylesterase
MSNNEREGEQSASVADLGRRGFVQASAGLGVGVALGTVPGTVSGSVSVTDHRITSTDGTEIAVTLYAPPSSDPEPAVLLTHGWGGRRNGVTTLGLIANYVTNGYVVASFDSRGFGDSGGESHLDGPPEVADVGCLLDWLADRPEVETVGPGNPRVGMDGLSYGGGIQLQVAGAEDRLDAIVPRITWNDLTYSLAPNGVIKGSWLSVLLGIGTIGSIDWGDGPRLFDNLSEWYWDAMEHNELPSDAATGLAARSVGQRVESYDTPTLLVQGLADTLFPPNEAARTYETLQNAGVESRLLLYGGGHTLEELTVPLKARYYMNRQVLSWMDRHLRGADEGVPQVMAVREPDDEWIESPTFPPSDVSFEPYAFDTATVDGEPTIAQWQWGVDSSVRYTWTVPRALELIGTPTLTLDLDVDGAEARLFARFLHDGEPINGLRAACRVGGPGARSTQIEYPTLRRSIDAGETVGLELSVSDPLFLNARESDGVTVGGSSNLTLPQRPR